MEEDIRREYERNLERFVVEVEPEYHKKALLPNLVVRKWMEENRLTDSPPTFWIFDPKTVYIHAFSGGVGATVHWKGICGRGRRFNGRIDGILDVGFQEHFFYGNVLSRLAQ